MICGEKTQNVSEFIPERGRKNSALIQVISPRFVLWFK